jgi:hypothetical protein
MSAINSIKCYGPSLKNFACQQEQSKQTEARLAKLFPITQKSKSLEKIFKTIYIELNGG